MTDAKRLKLILEVFETLYKATDSFLGDDLGCELAYLFAVIANPGPLGSVDWDKIAHEPHLDLFRHCFPASRPVWQFIQSS